VEDRGILTICLSPTIQKTLVVDSYKKDMTVRASNVWTEAGGKGVFVSRILRQIGLGAHHLSHCGRLTPEFERYVAKEGFDYTLLPTPSGIRTCSTIIEIDPDKSQAATPYVKTVTEFIEPSEAVPEDAGEKLFSYFEQLVSDASIVVISGSIAPGYDPQLIADMCEIAAARNCELLLDVRGDELFASMVHEPHVIKININEFAQTFLPGKAGWIEQCEEDGLELHKLLIEETLIDLTEDSQTSFIISRGPHAVWWASEGIFREQHLPAIHRSKILNPTGSGDAFTAGIAAVMHKHRVASGLEIAPGHGYLSEALNFGIRCAQQNAMILRPGNIRATQNELLVLES